MIDPKQAAVAFVNDYLEREFETLDVDEFLFEEYDEMKALEPDDQDHVLDKTIEESRRILNGVRRKFQQSNHPSGGTDRGTFQS